MKAMSVLKRLLQKGRIRLLMLLIVSFYSGSMMATQLQGVYVYDVAAGFWNKSSLNDCLVMQYEGKAVATYSGYNSRGLQVKKEIEAIEEIQAVYTTLRGIFSSVREHDTIISSTIALSQQWIEKAQLELDAGAWEAYNPQAGYVPAIANYEMRGAVQIGDLLEGDYVASYNFNDPEKGEPVSMNPLTIKITGFLPASGAYPNYDNAATVTDHDAYGMIANWYGMYTIEGETNNTILIPQEALQNNPNYELFQYSSGPLYLLQLEPDVAADEERINALIQRLSERGIGTAITGRHLGNLVRDKKEARQYLVIHLSILALYLLLELFSVTTFQSAFIYERRRTLAALHLIGMPWRSIGAGWMLLCTLCGVLPALAGIYWGSWKNSNHICFLPVTAWMYLLPIGLATLFGAIIFITLRRFAQAEPIVLLHGD